MPITIKVKGGEELEALKNKLMRWAVVAPEEVKKALSRAAEMVNIEVRENHLSGPKMKPPGTTGGFANSTLGTVTKALRGSIHNKVTVRPGEISAIVGTNVEYAARHEFGLEGMPERPFLRPSLAKKHDQVFNYIREAFFKSYGK